MNQKINKRIFFLILVSLGLLFWVGCSSVVICDSLTPTLSWEAYSPGKLANKGDLMDQVKNLSYQIKIIRLSDKTIVYERKGIKETKHQVDKTLDPSTHYAWSVRPHFEYRGQVRVGVWRMWSEGWNHTNRSPYLPEPENSYAKILTPAN